MEHELKVSELRVGNLINRGLAANNPLDTIHFELSRVTIPILHEIVSSLVWDHEPILLTQKWLHKFGCPEIGGGHRTFKFKGSIYLIELRELRSSEYCLGMRGEIGEEIMFGPQIKYVHQLQNLYFALTGEELELQKQK